MAGERRLGLRPLTQSCCSVPWAYAFGLALGACMAGERRPGLRPLTRCCYSVPWAYAFGLALGACMAGERRLGLRPLTQSCCSVPWAYAFGLALGACMAGERRPGLRPLTQGCCSVSPGLLCPLCMHREEAAARRIKRFPPGFSHARAFGFHRTAGRPGFSFPHSHNRTG